MHGDVLGEAVVAGLHELDGEDVHAACGERAGHEPRGDGLADAGIDAGDEIDFLHGRIFYHNAVWICARVRGIILTPWTSRNPIP